MRTGVDLRVVRAWLAMVLWIAVIWGLGSDQMSDRQTESRFLGPLIDWLLPDLSLQARHAVMYSIRKTAHVVEYAILALLSIHALWLSWRKPLRLTSLYSAGIVTVVAIADEVHQGLTSERTSSGWDVLLDIAGGVAAIAGVWLLRRLRPNPLKVPNTTPNSQRAGSRPSPHAGESP